MSLFSEEINRKLEEKQKENSSILSGAINEGLAAAKPGGIKLIAKEGMGGAEEESPKGLMKVLDVLQRPNYAIAGAAKALVEGDSVLAEAAKGLMGRERDTFSDVLGSLGWEPTTTKGKIARGAAGFALDVLLDPTTYVGIGGLTKTGKAAAKIGKLAPTASKQAKLGQKALFQFMGKTVVTGEKVFEKTGDLLNIVRASGAGDKLGRAFIPNFRPASVDPEIWQQMVRIGTAAKNVRQYKTSKAMDLAVKAQVITNRLIKEHGEDTLIKTLTAIEQPGKRFMDTVSVKDSDKILDLLQSKKLGKRLVDSLPEDAQELVKISREYLDEISAIRESAKKGLLNSDDLKYLPHVHTEDYIGDLKRVFGKAKVYSTTTPADKTREVMKFVDDAGNVLGIGRPEAFGLKKAKDGSFVEVARRKAKNLPPEIKARYQGVLPTIEEKLQAGYEMETKIGTLLGIAGSRNAKLESSMVYFDQVKDLSTNMGGLDNLSKLKDAVPVKAPELKGRLFNPEIAREIDSVYEKLINPQSIDDMVKLYDNVQNSWKGLATFVNPAFHSRNAVSNVYNNFLAGVKSPKSYAKASIIQAVIQGEEVPIELLKKIDKRYGKIKAVQFKQEMGKLIKQYYSDFQQQGLRGGTFFGSDIEKSIARNVDPTLLGSRKLGQVTAKGRQLGLAVEENARLAHFIDKIDKGFTPEAAAESVKKFLFDYDELTEFERGVMKRIVPFYTWTRKNIPLQLEMLAKKPRHALGLGKAVTNMEKTLDTNRINKSLLPEWMQKSAPIVVGAKDNEVQVFRLEGYLPIADIARLEPEEMGKQLIGMTSPLIKILPELILNTNTFFEKKIQEVPGERKDLLRVKVNPYLDHVLRQIRPINELDKLIGKSQDDVSKKAKVTNLLFGGKIYHIDLNKQKRINDYLKRQKIQLLKSKARYNFRLGDVEEGRRMLKEIKKL